MSQAWVLIFTFPTRRTPLNNCFWNSFSSKDLVENKFASFEKVKRQIVEKQFFSQVIGIVGQRVKKHFRCSAGCTGSASENHFFKLFPADVQLAQCKRLFLESLFGKISQNLGRNHFSKKLSPEYESKDYNCNNFRKETRWSDVETGELKEVIRLS